MVKLLSGKRLHTTLDSTPQNPLVEARKMKYQVYQQRGDHQINTPTTYFSCLCACL